MKNIVKIKLLILKIGIRYFENLRNSKLQIIFPVYYKISRWIWEKLAGCNIFIIKSNKEYSVSHDSFSKLIRKDRIGYSTEVCSMGKVTAPQTLSAALPDLMLYCHKGVSIIAGSDHIISRREHIIINDFCSDNDKDDNNNIYIDKKTYMIQGRTAIIRDVKNCRDVKAGIMMSGKFPFNYYHVLFENLIRILALKDVIRYIPSDVPFVVDEEVMSVSSFHRVFEILTSEMNREVIVINNNEMLNFGRLYCITSVNYLVPKYKDERKGEVTDYLFDKEYVLRLRNCLLPFKSDNKYPKRLFLTRNKAAHRKFNEDEIYEILKPYGFVKVAPENYTFEEQMSLFDGAECVMGGSGAAFTNILFCHEPCVAITFFKYSTYLAPVFSTPLGFSGGEFMSFLSQDQSLDKAPQTINYNIDKDVFKEYFFAKLLPQLEYNSKLR